MVNYIDIVVIVILGLCIILAIFSMRKRKCHDCTHCQYHCGGKQDGKEFKCIIKNKRN